MTKIKSSYQLIQKCIGYLVIVDKNTVSERKIAVIDMVIDTLNEAKMKILKQKKTS